MEKKRVLNEVDNKDAILSSGLLSLKHLVEELRSCSIASSLHAERLYNLNIDFDQKDHDSIFNESQNVAASVKHDTLIEQEIGYIKTMLELSIADVKSTIDKIKGII